ncbi:iron ABC transporter substrate-binding protein [Nocardioides sp. Root151]|uniref:iron ABC transporter substrate-binding protein n=1 Tax=Nocardioides sp. Root151 TaxID=1736475 RepID=UPI00070376CD|nr:iron ABC transporter substrate-binding protein [Nocardioides sp. Root151]KQZ66812.1 iron ABC transporter substrate-binding protein [Nocardioides sp. Root151]
MSPRLVAAAVPLLLLSGLLSACSEDDGPSITVYNAQHEELLEELVPIFEKETGIDVKLRNGKDFELANQIVTEGEASPADVFLTENSPAMSLVESEGLFSPLPADTLALTPKQFRPVSGNWTGFAARSTVVMYNKDDIAPEDLPTSILDFADPKWKGKVSFSPTGADFQAIVSAVLELKGEDATKEWLVGLAENGEVYDGNNIVMQSVNDGETPTGIAYHYYWYRDQKESGENSANTELYFFGNQDPGAFVSVSGAGVLESSDKQEDAQEFVKFLVDKTGQQALADSYALEYPLNPAAELEPLVKPFGELEPPTVDVSKLNGPKVIELMQGAGLI